MLFGDQGLWMLFKKGGPIMWPLLLSSVIASGVVIERLIFIYREKRNRRPEILEQVLINVEVGRIEEAIKAGAGCEDFVVKAICYGLMHRDQSFASALLKAANQELKRFSQGLTVLDTTITLAPLLGLLGTVTGMINAFGLLGANELDAPAAITGGIAEALIATGFGLAIAIVSLIPFNYLNARLEEARHEIEDCSTHLELLLTKHDRRVV